MIVERNIMINNSGGTASKNGKTYRISIPAGMVRELGVTADDRTVILKSDNGKIVIEKK